MRLSSAEDAAEQAKNEKEGKEGGHPICPCMPHATCGSGGAEGHVCGVFIQAVILVRVAMGRMLPGPPPKQLQSEGLKEEEKKKKKKASSAEN